MLTKLIPLGLVIALSPITVIPAVLVLHAPRPRPAGLAFLAGWVLGLVALTAVFVGASDLLGGLQHAPPRWASWLRVVLGSALIVFGVFSWLTRHRHTKTPAWLRSFTKLNPVRAGVTGAVLVIRPEVLILCAMAGLAIGTGGLNVAGGLIAAQCSSSSPHRLLPSPYWAMSVPVTASTTHWNGSKSGWKKITAR